MQVVEIEKWGGPDVLQVKEHPGGQSPQRGEVRLRVRAASYNPVDGVVSSGKLRLVTGSRLPQRLGHDFAGEVIGVGPEVDRWRPGDEVIGCLKAGGGGAWASELAVPADELAPKPANLDHAHAAALPLCGLTALQALRDVAGLPDRTNARVLVNGASGGVGHLAVQLARELGAQAVVGTAGPQNLPLLRELGCDAAVDYHQPEAIAQNGPYHVVLDAAAKLSFTACRAWLTDDGMYVTTRPGAQQAAETAATKLAHAAGYGKRATFVMVRPDAQDLAHLSSLVADGRLRTVVARVYDLPAVQQFAADAEAHHRPGKYVLRMN